MPKYVRARQGVPLLLHPDTGELVSVDPTKPMDASDPLVKKFGWAFASDEELAEESVRNAQYVTEVPIEAAEAKPGQKRNTKRS